MRILSLVLCVVLVLGLGVCALGRERIGPYSGTTDAEGRFIVPIPDIADTYITGLLTECTERPLPEVSVTVRVDRVYRGDVVDVEVEPPDPIWVPGFNGGFWYYPPAPPPPPPPPPGDFDIQSVRISSPGYPSVTVSRFRVSRSNVPQYVGWDAVDLGTVCLRPPEPVEPIYGETDGAGQFSVTISPGVGLTGTLTECAIGPLRNQEFEVMPEPKVEWIASPEDIGAFTFFVPGHYEITITEFSVGWMFVVVFDVGSICFTASGETCYPGDIGDRHRTRDVQHRVNVPGGGVVGEPRPSDCSKELAFEIRYCRPDGTWGPWRQFATRPWYESEEAATETDPPLGRQVIIVEESGNQMVYKLMAYREEHGVRKWNEEWRFSATLRSTPPDPDDACTEGEQIHVQRFDGEGSDRVRHWEIYTCVDGEWRLCAEGSRPAPEQEADNDAETEQPQDNGDEEETPEWGPVKPGG